MSRATTISLYTTMLVALWHYETVQMYLEKRSNGHADISFWSKVGKFKIVLGPCLATGRDQGNIEIQVTIYNLGQAIKG